MLFTKSFLSLFRYPNNILDVSLHITPHSVIIYNPFFQNDIELYYIDVTDKEFIVYEGFELTRKVKTVLLDQPINTVIYNILLAINEFKNIKRQRTWIVFDTKTPNLVVDIFRLLPYLNTQVIKDIFGDILPLKDIPTALCFIKLLEFSYNLHQSDDTGILREFHKEVIMKKSFYELMHSSIEKNLFWSLFNYLYVNRKFYVLFGRKIGPYVVELLERGDISDIVKLIELIFQMGYISDNSKFNVRRTSYIQVTDNKQLVYYIKNGELPEKNVSATNKMEVAYLDVGLKDNKTEIAHFFQWSSFPNKQQKQKILCNHYILSKLDKSPERWNIIKKRLEQTIFPKKTVIVNGRKSLSDYTVKQGERIKNKICSLSAETFFTAESMFTARMYYNIEDEGDNFKEDIKHLFISDKIEKQLIYSKLLNYNIFCNKQEEEEYEDINIDEYILHFKKKFRFCRYEGFYAVTVLEIFDMRYFDVEELTKRIKDQNEAMIRPKYMEDRTVENKVVQLWLRYSSNDIYSAKRFLDNVEGFSKGLQDNYYKLGGHNNQIILYFQKKDIRNHERMDEVMCRSTLELFNNHLD